MLIKLIYYIGIILAENQTIEVEDDIRIITDRYFKEIVGDNGSNLSNDAEVIYVDKNEYYGKILWDKYFIRPFFYKIKLKDLNNSANNISFNTNCISDNKEVIYRFKFSRDLQKTTFSDFHGPNNSELNIRKISNNIKTYVLYQNDENYNALRNTFQYMGLFKLTDAPCSSLLTRFSDLIENLKDLQRYAKDFDCKDSFINEIQEIKKITFEAANSIAKIYVSLKFPGLNKENFKKSYEYFEQYIFQISKRSNDIAKVFKKNCLKQNMKIRDYLLTFLQTFKLFVKYLNERQEEFGLGFDKEFIKSSLNSSYTFKTLYDWIIENIRKIDNLKKESDQKGVENEELVSYRNLDHFYESYSSSLLEYCEVMEICDELYLIDYCLKNNDKDCFTMIEEINFDILAAKEMKKYLLIYQTDKTEFLIFSQTEYFRNKMLDRIIENLEDFIILFGLKVENIDVKENDLKVLYEGNLKKLNKMKTLQIQWLNFKELHNSFYDYLNKQNASDIQNDNATNNSNGIIEESDTKENQEVEHLDREDENYNQNEVQKTDLMKESKRNQGVEHLDEEDENIDQNEVQKDVIVEESTSGSEEVQSENNEEINEKFGKNEVQKSDLMEESTSGSEEIQSENNEEINEKFGKNEVYKTDLMEESTSVLEEIQSENNEEINEKLEKNEVQKSDKKEDVLKQDSLNAPEDINKLNEGHIKIASKPVPVHKQDKENKIIDQSKPVEIQEIPNKNDENLKISIQENESKNNKSYSLLYYIIATAFFSLLFFGIIYLIISKYRNRTNH